MKKILLILAILSMPYSIIPFQPNWALCTQQPIHDPKLDNQTPEDPSTPKFATPITNLFKPRNLVEQFNKKNSNKPWNLDKILGAMIVKLIERTKTYDMLEECIGRQLTQTGHDMVRKEVYSGNILEPSKIALTYSAKETLEQTVQALENNGLAHHFIINTNGDIHPVTREGEAVEQALKHRAYALGVSYFKGLRDMNSASISISVVGTNNKFATPEQKQALIDLLFWLEQKFNITPDNVVDYGCIAYPYCDEKRNRTPQEYLPWEELAAVGVATYPTQADWHNTQDNFENEDARVKWTSLALIKLGYNVDATRNPNHEKLVPALMVFKKHVRLSDGTSNITPETIGALNAMIIQHEACDPKLKDIEPPALPLAPSTKQDDSTLD